MTKKARKSHHLERFNNALRPRASRLVREPLSSPKQLAHHIGAMQYVMCYDNLTRATAAA